MFNEIMNGIHSFNLPLAGNYFVVSEQSLIGILVLAVAAVIALFVIVKVLGAIGRAIFKK